MAKNRNKLYTLLPTDKKGIADIGSKTYNNPTLEDLEGEVWVDAFGFDGIYEVSNLGRIKSLERRVATAKGSRRVRSRIRKQVLVKDGRLTCPLSQNNIITPINVSAFIFYSFNTHLKNDKLKDEVYHRNKITWDNRIENLSYNKTKGASYKISMDLGNVKHLKDARKKHHKHTKEKSIFKNGRTTHRTCRCCGLMKEQKEYSRYGTNTCISCEKKRMKDYYRKRANIKGTKQQTKIVIKIEDTKTGEVFISKNKAKCIISKSIINRYANTGNLVFPYKNSKHKNPLLITIDEIKPT